MQWKKTTLIAYVITVLDKISHTISLRMQHAAIAAAAPTSSFPHHTERITEQEDHNVSVSALPISTTKGIVLRSCEIC
jgi:hypothetical protein